MSRRGSSHSAHARMAGESPAACDGALRLLLQIGPVVPPPLDVVVQLGQRGHELHLPGRHPLGQAGQVGNPQVDRPHGVEPVRLEVVQAALDEDPLLQPVPLGQPLGAFPRPVDAQREAARQTRCLCSSERTQRGRHQGGCRSYQGTANGCVHCETPASLRRAGPTTPWKGPSTPRAHNARDPAAAAPAADSPPDRRRTVPGPGPSGVGVAVERHTRPVDRRCRTARRRRCCRSSAAACGRSRGSSLGGRC